MRLDGGGELLAESRALADVGHARMELAVDRDRGGIDAVRRDQLVGGGQVRGRKPELAAAPGALHHGAVDGVVMAEQRAGLVDAPFAHQPADARAGDDEILVADRIDLFGAEAVLRAERPQQREVAAAIAAEQEIGANPHLGDAQPLHQHAAHEVIGLPLRHLAGEADHRRALHTGARQRIELLRLGHQQRRRLVGTEDAGRMRIERQHHAGAGAFGGAALDALDDLDVAAMQAVEVAEREHRRAPPERPRILRIVDDVHCYATSMSNVMPS